MKICCAKINDKKFCCPFFAALLFRVCVLCFFLIVLRTVKDTLTFDANQIFRLHARVSDQREKKKLPKIQKNKNELKRTKRNA